MFSLGVTRILLRSRSPILSDGFSRSYRFMARAYVRPNLTLATKIVLSPELYGQLALYLTQ